jgi:membrane protein YqaA with SNARE-associated domain
VVDSIEGAVGIYLASFVIAIISGAFPLVNAEVYLVGITLASKVEWPELILLGVIIACGQMVSHSLLFHAARGVTNLGGRKREKLEARIARARTRVAKWGNKKLLLLVTSAIFGLPPFLLTCVAAGALEIRYRMFATIGLAGRIVRFTAIALIAGLV